MKILLTPNESFLKSKYRIWTYANSSKEEAKMGLFGYDSVPELNTKNLTNSPSFLSVTHTTLSTKQFRSYRISNIDSAAEFCPGQNSGWTELNFWASGCPKLRKYRIPLW
jgi:hypothetical protein